MIVAFHNSLQKGAGIYAGVKMIAEEFLEASISLTIASDLFTQAPRVIVP
jgi:hypothetical protein